MKWMQKNILSSKDQDRDFVCVTVNDVSLVVDVVAENSDDLRVEHEQRRKRFFG